MTITAENIKICEAWRLRFNDPVLAQKADSVELFFAEEDAQAFKKLWVAAAENETDRLNRQTKSSIEKAVISDEVLSPEETAQKYCMEKFDYGERTAIMKVDVFWAENNGEDYIEDTDFLSVGINNFKICEAHLNSNGEVSVLDDFIDSVECCFSRDFISDEEYPENEHEARAYEKEADRDIQKFMEALKPVLETQQKLLQDRP